MYYALVTWYGYGLVACNRFVLIVFIHVETGVDNAMTYVRNQCILILLANQKMLINFVCDNKIYTLTASCHLKITTEYNGEYLKKIHISYSMTWGQIFMVFADNQLTVKIVIMSTIIHVQCIMGMIEHNRKNWTSGRFSIPLLANTRYYDILYN